MESKGFVVVVVVVGVFNYVSYRDPKLADTLATYDGTAAFVGGMELDEGGFLEDLGECEVPVKAFKYDETNPVGRAMKAREFVETYWGRSNKGMYMHQFQFPCSEDEQARRLCNQSKDLPVLGDNLLK